MTSTIKNRIPLNWDLIVQYYIYFATSSWFTLGIWYVFFSKVASPEMIAIIHSIGFVVGLLFDVPSGYLADKLGRKRLLLIGIFLFSTGCFLFAFIKNVPQMILIEIIVQLGLACISGTQEAVLHNTVSSLVPDKSMVDTAYNTVYARARVLTNTALILGGAIGGFAYNYNEKLPWFMMSALCFIGFFLGLSIKDHHLNAPAEEKATSALLHLKEGFAVFRQKHTRYLLPAVLLLGGTAFISDWGIFSPGVLTNSGISPFMLSIFFAAVYAINIPANHYLPKLYDLFGKTKGFEVYGYFTCATMLFLGIFFRHNVALVVVAMAAFIVSSSLLMGYASSVINSVTTERHRATTLSVASIAMKLPYLLVAPLIGLSFSKNVEWAAIAGFGTITLATSLVMSYGSKLRRA